MSLLDEHANDGRGWDAPRQAGLLIAVDPGASGGIAWLDPREGAQAVKTPANDAGLLELCRTLARRSYEFYRSGPRVAIELVGGYVKPPKLKRVNPGIPGSEVVGIEGGQPGSAMFKFGENAGLVRGMLLALGADVELVTPQKWQAPLFVKKRGTEKAQWKRILRDMAQRRFPNLKVTLATADALLLLHYWALRNGQSALLVREGSQKQAGEAIRKRIGHSGGSPQPAKSAESLRVVDWQGDKWVLREPVKPGAQGVLIRRATPADLEALPR